MNQKVAQTRTSKVVRINIKSIRTSKKITRYWWD